MSDGNIAFLITDQMLDAGLAEALQAERDGLSVYQPEFIRRVVEATLRPPAPKEELTKGVYRSIWQLLRAEG